MKRLFLLIFGIITAFSYSQEEGDESLDDFLDEFLTEENQVVEEFLKSLQEYDVLFLSLDYTTDTYFAGRDIGLDQYNLATQLSYVNSSGFSLGVAGIYYENFDPKWDVTIASIGYSGDIGKKKLFNYRTGYSRYFFSNPEDNLFKNAFDVGLGVRTKNRNLGLQLTGTLLTGDETVFQFVARTYTNLRLYKSKKLSLAFRPQLRFIAGQQTIELSRTVTLFGREREDFYEDTVFDLVNTQLNLPVQLYLGNWSFEAGYNLNFPNPVGEEPDVDTTGFFNLSVAYLLDL